MNREKLTERVQHLSAAQKEVLKRLLLHDGATATADQQLVAYIAADQALEESSIKAQMRAILPAYMVPQQVVLVKELPKLPNGKVDTQGLSALSHHTPSETSLPQAKQRILVQTLIQIWEEVLHIKPVQLDDNFFEIGGDSMLSIQIVSKAQKKGIELTNHQLFEQQSIREIVQQLESNTELPTQKENKATTPSHSSNTLTDTLIQIWEEVLHIKPVHIDDNFFEIGGDSMLSIQIVSKAQKKGIELTNHQLFEQQSIREIVQQLESNTRILETEVQKGNQNTTTTNDLLSIDESLVNSPENTLLPLSFIQKALLFHAKQAQEDQGIIHMEIGIRGAINTALFTQAWEYIIQYHAILRTSLTQHVDGVYFQKTHPHAPYSCKEHDWRHHKPTTYQQQLLALKQQIKHEDIDLMQAPISSWHLIRTEDNSYLLLWNTHHLLLDALGALVILKDVFSCYDALFYQKKLVLTAPPSYQDYLDWINAQPIAAPKTVFQEMLSKLPEPTLFVETPTTQKTATFQTKHYALSSEATERIKRFAQSQRVALNSFLNGLWALILGKHFEAETISYGITVSGRPPQFQGIELMSNQFMNTLPVCLQLPPNQVFSSWIQEQQGQLNRIRKYEYISLDQIANWQEKASGSPLFDSLFVFTHSVWQDVKSGNLVVHEMDSHVTSTYPITIAIKEGKSLSLSLQYDREVISSELADWLLRQLQTLLTLPSFEGTLEQLQAHLEDAIHNKTKLATSVHEPFPISKYEAPSQNVLELQLITIWENLFSIRGIQKSDNFFDLGGTSLQAVQLFAHLEDIIGKRLSATLLFQHPTIAQLAIAIGDEKSLSWTPIVPMQSQGNRPPLFIIHAVGGFVFSYRELANAMHKNQPVYGIQAKGVLEKNPDISSIEAISSYYIEEIQKIQPTGPYLLAGMSLGGIIAFEICQQLQQKGEEVSFLGLFDTHPTVTPQRFSWLSVLDRHFGHALMIGFLEKFKNIKSRIVKRLQTKGVLDSHHDSHQQYRATLHDRLIQVLQAYKVRPYSGKITLFMAKQNYYRGFQDDRLLWHQYALHGLEVHQVAGSHVSMLQGDNSQQLANMVHNCIERSLQSEKTT